MRFRGNELIYYEDMSMKGERMPADQQTSEMETRFTYHKPKEGQAEKYVRIRNQARVLADLLQEACPESREKSLAFTKIEEAVMWANAAIARRE